ncbi:MAG: lysoplasmalogenase [Myxococcota bacterium]
MAISSIWTVTLGLVALVLSIRALARAGNEAHARPLRVVEAFFKAAASATFLLVASRSGLAESPHGRALFVGLGAAAAGDILLVWGSRPSFLAGLVAFLLAHVAYGVSFALRGIDLGVALAAGAVLGGIAVVAGRWLLPYTGPLREPVLAYILVISAMMTLAVASAAQAGSPWVAIGAGLFYLSDLFVARERFVRPTFTNRLIGLPIYYLGQLILATFGG